MAAVAQAQIRKFESKIKPYLHEGLFDSYWNSIEQKTNVKREQYALGLLGILALYLAFGWGNDFLCNFIGFLYPAYASILAIESKGTQNDTLWLVYWVVYALFGVIEYIGHSFFHSLPLYWLAKCLFLIWLMVPRSKGGSQVLYHRLIQPLVAKHRPTAHEPSQKGNIDPSESVARDNN